MQLTVRDAARILNVSEKIVYRWISQGTIPVYRVQEQYRFNRAELLEWATSHGVSASLEILEEPEGRSTPLLGLADALAAGGICYDVAGTTKEQVLQAVVDAMHLPGEVDRKFLYQVLLAREALGSTGIGDGIAIPHVRNPIVLHVPAPAVTLCFLRGDVDFGAIDNRPVHTLFSMISPTVRAHLHLLSRLAYALRDEHFRDVVIKRKAPAEEILAAARAVEASLRPAHPVEHGAGTDAGDSSD